MITTTMNKKGQNFKVDFIGIGAPKCATLWIFNCLKQHPQICGCSHKESNFFGKNYFRGINWYRRLYKKCPPGKIKGEFSPGYLYDDKAPERIIKNFPDIKLIVCLRNPIDRLISAHYHSLSRGKISRYQYGTNSFSELDIDRGLYYKHLEKFIKLFSSNQILILIYEDIKSNPASFIKKIYTFLDIDEGFSPNIIDKKLNVTMENLVRIPQINQAFFKIRNWILTNKYGGVLIKFIKVTGINKIAIFIFKLNRRKNNLRPVAKPELASEIKKQLIEYYASDVGKLKRLINRKLTSWKEFN